MKYEARRIVCDGDDVSGMMNGMAIRGWKLVSAIERKDGMRELYYQRKAKPKSARVETPMMTHAGSFAAEAVN